MFGACDIIDNDVCAPTSITNFRYQNNYLLTADEKWINVDKNSISNKKKSKDTYILYFMNITIYFFHLYVLQVILY